MLAFIRHFLFQFMRFSARHRLSLAVGLYSFTWASGALVLYGIGKSFSSSGTEGLRWGILDCMYMAAITLTTVGFEVAVDMHALTPEGQSALKVFLTIYTLTAYIVALYATGAIISVFVEGAVLQFFKRRRMDRELNRIEGHYIVCGCGTTGIHVADELVKLKRKVVLIDSNPAHLKHAQEHYPEAILLEGDALDDEVLAQAHVDRAVGLFAVLPEDRDNILLTVSARQMNTHMRVVVRASQFGNEAKFLRVGANSVISPNHIGGLRMASQMVRPIVVDFLDTMVRDHQHVVRFENVTLKPGGKADGKQLGDLGIFKNLGLAVIGVMRANERVEYNPGGSTVLYAGDSVIVITDPDRLNRLEALLN
ncbi:MAG: potassium channel protein [Planctomycetes bacterium]|nr:potassium channel protein [Planctomycetota bacterium]